MRKEKPLKRVDLAIWRLRLQDARNRLSEAYWQIPTYKIRELARSKVAIDYNSKQKGYDNEEASDNEPKKEEIFPRADHLSIALDGPHGSLPHMRYSLWQQLVRHNLLLYWLMVTLLGDYAWQRLSVPTLDKRGGPGFAPRWTGDIRGEPGVPTSNLPRGVRSIWWWESTCNEGSARG